MSIKSVYKKIKIVLKYTSNFRTPLVVIMLGTYILINILLFVFSIDMTAERFQKNSKEQYIVASSVVMQTTAETEQEFLYQVKTKLASNYKTDFDKRNFWHLLTLSEKGIDLYNDVTVISILDVLHDYRFFIPIESYIDEKMGERINSFFGEMVKKYPYLGISSTNISQWYLLSMDYNDSGEEILPVNISISPVFNAQPEDTLTLKLSDFSITNTISVPKDSLVFTSYKVEFGNMFLYSYFPEYYKVNDALIYQAYQIEEDFITMSDQIATSTSETMKNEEEVTLEIKKILEDFSIDDMYSLAGINDNDQRIDYTNSDICGTSINSWFGYKNGTLMIVYYVEIVDLYKEALTYYLYQGYWANSLMAIIFCGLIVYVAYIYVFWANMRLDEAHNLFIRGITHEIRTPLNVIVGACAYISDFDINDSEIQRRNFDKISRQASRIQNLVKQLSEQSNLLTAKRITGKEIISLSDLLQEELNHYEDLLCHEGKSVIKKIDTGILVLGNEQTIRIVIDNFLSNARKYSSNVNGEKTVVSIELSASKRNFKIVFYNDCVEMPDTDLVWNAWYRGDSIRNRTESSSGVGLTITKKILDLHRFKYKCYKKNSGIVFEVTGKLLLKKGGKGRKIL